MTTVSRTKTTVISKPVRRGIVVALWVIVAAATVVRLRTMFGQPILPGVNFHGAEGYFLDFRDTVWAPGRSLLSGGNPYDPDTYLAKYPWALPFSLYSPPWLYLGVVLAPLPYLVSVAAFQVLSIGVAILMLRVLCKWAMPSLADLAVPLGLLWLNIWYPGRGVISVQLGTLLGAFGVLLVVRSLASRKSTVDKTAVVGVALTLIKVQFGVAALAALFGGRIRETWRGIVGVVVVSLPIMAVCSVAAGGPVSFVRSVFRDFEVLNGPTAPTGLSNPVQRRFDLLGELARWGLTHPPMWVQILILVPALAAVAFVARRTKDALVLSTVLCTAMLVGVYHNPYDLVLLVIPVAIGLGRALRRELTHTADWIMVAAVTIVVLHLHSVSGKLVPAIDMRMADTIDLALVCVALLCGLYRAITGVGQDERIAVATGARHLPSGRGVFQGRLDG